MHLIHVCLGSVVVDVTHVDRDGFARLKKFIVPIKKFIDVGTVGKKPFQFKIFVDLSRANDLLFKIQKFKIDETH
tara:strand:+ start:199 stop:423 length:225 start_codon:yes stop_codon:yes gene_type:complete